MCSHLQLFGPLNNGELFGMSRQAGLSSPQKDIDGIGITCRRKQQNISVSIYVNTFAIRNRQKFFDFSRLPSAHNEACLSQAEATEAQRRRGHIMS
jgi:hypothetical protein